MLATTTFLLMTGCSGGNDAANKVASITGSDTPVSSDAPAGDNKTDEDRMREFAKCMREHGVDMKDPSADGGVVVEARPGDEEKMKAADEACRHLLPNGGKPPELSAEDLDKLREQAKCLREHGLNVPDPDPDEPGIRIEAGDDPEKAQEAMKACGMGEGPGSGGGGSKIDAQEPTK